MPGSRMPQSGDEASPPPASSGSWLSATSMRRPPRVPRSTIRGSATAVTWLTVTMLIAPEACVRITVVSSSVGSPSRIDLVHAATATTGPISCMAWSIAWTPRSYSSPPMSSGAAEPRQPAFGRTRILTMRDSKRWTVPSRPSASTRCAVRMSLSQRRFWKGMRRRPSASATSASARAASAVAAIGLSSTTCSPAARASAAYGTWVTLAVLIAARSWPPVQASETSE